MKNSSVSDLKFVVVLLGILILSNGCAYLATHRPSAPKTSEIDSQLETETDDNGKTDQDYATMYRFTDVPVPAKFKLDREKSFIYQAGDFKVGMMSYKGWSKLETLVDFYKKEMPAFNWKIVNIFEHKDVTLVYAKEGWNCTVRIYYKNLGGSKIEIQIGPTNQQ